MRPRARLPTNRAFHITAPYFAGVAAVGFSTTVGLSTIDATVMIAMALMGLALIVWAYLVLRAFRELGALALVTLPSGALTILAGTLLPALYGCVLTQRCL